jgi:methylmalonyl-CoA mutase
VEASAALEHSWHTNALDEQPTDFSAELRYTDIYRKKQNPKTVDPWAGSYYVERLTHELPTMRGNLLKC